MVQTLSPNGSNEALCDGVCFGVVRRTNGPENDIRGWLAYVAVESSSLLQPEQFQLRESGLEHLLRVEPLWLWRPSMTERADVVADKE